MRPAIGISQCLDDQGRWRAGRDYLYLDAAYPRALERVGAIPVQLPIQADAGTLLERIDALVLPGGDDLPAPTPYPEDVHFDLAPQEQVDFDRALLAGARERGLPVLGICYGMQLMALAAGGSLHYHLPLDLPQAAEHRLPEVEGRHSVVVSAGTRLADILPGECPVNSLHHQAVDAPGRGMRVSARAGDGVVEAIESEGACFEIGVQWHPEKLRGSDALFRALVDAARKRTGIG